MDFTAQKCDSLIRHLRKNIAGEVRFDSSSRRLYSTDASIYQIEPLGVVIPKTPEDLLTAVQIALETRTPITARGGGTSLSGQSIGPGVVMDCSKYLNQIGPIDVAERKVRVQPGVVLDQLNRALRPHGLQFGPEVATASRATLGGMMGNNSAGSRSIVYGKTDDHVRSLKAILSDGRLAEFGPLAQVDWERKASLPTLEGAAYREVRRIVGQNEEEIRRRFPKILRRVSGYNLDACLPGGPTNAFGAFVDAASRARDLPSMVRLLIGSEGTLAVVTEAELNLVPRPKHRGLLVPHFASLAAALESVAVCLEFAPSAVELMDTMLIRLAQEQRSLKEVTSFLVGQPAALFMVEFSSDSALEVSDRVERLERRLKEVPGVTATVRALDPAIRDPLWDLRRAAMPVLYSMPGDRKPVTFVEDAAVTPERLPEFAQRFREILRRHGTDGSYYGHASVGCLHIRPVLNLKDPDDVQRMRAITEDITDLVLAFGGSLSGEHGDGLARSEWNRKMYGPAVYEAFREVKRAFDPDNLFNPGKVVDAPAMTENLRYGNGYRPIALPTVFDYSRQEGFYRSVEMCNGNGACRKTHGGAMCPSFRATRDERDNTRGRANALRLAIHEPTGHAGSRNPLRERWLFDVMDLCLSCKACKAECPSNVDVAKLKAEWQHAYYERRLRPLGHYLLAHVHRVNRYGAALAPVLNWLNRRKLTRWLLEKTAGIDRRRSLPEIQRKHFRRWFARRRSRVQGRRVLLFDDCFTSYHEPQIGRAAVQVLEAAGCSVELVNPICCGRALLSKGFLKEARGLAQAQLPPLARRVADGTPILGLEPSCVLTLSDEWPELVPSAAAREVAAAVHLADHWLADEARAGRTTLSLNQGAQKVLFHGHCHQKALCGVKGSAAALRLVPSSDVKVLDAGCCGMAGAFGYEKEHYDVSVKIANLTLLPALKAEPDATVAATGTSCRHQIRDLTGREALHPMEVIAAALRGAARG
jgi:FAD/FMN-containing dehydrogenase/Fe-S oxidoreductase